jgi:hypothetical protein
MLGQPTDFRNKRWATAELDRIKSTPKAVMYPRIPPYY